MNSQATTPTIPEKVLLPILESSIASIATAVEKESGLFPKEETKSFLDLRSMHQGNIFVGWSFVHQMGPRRVLTKGDPKTNQLQVVPSHEMLDDSIALTLYFNRTTPFVQRT